jgi:hypothetical protein
MMMRSVVRPTAMAKNTNKKNTMRQKAVQERRSELKDIRGTLSEISKKERKRMSGLLELHRGFFGRGDTPSSENENENETVDAVVIPNSSIDDYFDGAGK